MLHDLANDGRLMLHSNEQLKTEGWRQRKDVRNLLQSRRLYDMLFINTTLLREPIRESDFGSVKSRNRSLTKRTVCVTKRSADTSSSPGVITLQWKRSQRSPGQLQVGGEMLPRLRPPRIVEVRCLPVTVRRPCGIPSCLCALNIKLGGHRTAPCRMVQTQCTVVILTLLLFDTKCRCACWFPAKAGIV